MRFHLHARTWTKFVSLASLRVIFCMVRKYIAKKEKARAAERKLLLSLARGKKSVQEVVDDAEVFSFADTSLQRLVTSKAFVGVAQRLEELTGIGNNSLDSKERTGVAA